MTLAQRLYFMSIVGGIAGLAAWVLQAIIVSLIPAGSLVWISVVTAAGLLGGLIGGFSTGFDDRWLGNRIQLRWIAVGTVIGIFAGSLSGAVHLLVTAALPGAVMLSVVLSWILTGALIGVGLGARWLAVNPSRIAHSMLGGMAGGFLGGLVFGTMSDLIPDVSQALAFSLTGTGICFGVAFAPILFRDAVVRLVASGDARVMSKIGEREWEIQDGDSLVIGSKSSDLSKTSYGRDVDIYLPDALVAPRHARLYGKNGRFFVTRHPDIMSEAGLRRFVLRVQDRSITAPYELTDDSLMVLGRTTLMFAAKKDKRERRSE